MAASLPHLVDGEVPNPSVYNPDFLRQQARLIRDVLDPLVARDGPGALDCDTLLELDEFLRRLLTSSVVLEDVKYSRLHLAAREIAGKATRWPDKLIDRCDELIALWEERWGDLKGLKPLLYESGGRLHGIARPEDLSNERLLVKWLKAPGVRVSPSRARKVGDLGFKPGDWWINAMFAFRDGILDSGDPRGGVVADANGAYALLMTADEEVWGPSLDGFKYRARSNDRGRFRLTAASVESRQPVRVLRSHTMRSLWAPRAGVRYDGLYKVEGWCIYQHHNRPVYEVSFRRLPGQVSADRILCRPFADEVEDYREYKRLRKEAAEEQSLLQAASLKRRR